ncbi:ribulose-phosphate 3-epimerase, putative [Ichthyophthirius multifiliis]|uniref:GrpE protein homolog n=1 Tax=Ichthyophthirius multifiliis TaxID=5932 RepID=G0QWV9_ICHMU|nr:ribulose-phosphate 3-epimerase, putative [Ichthyophthirius multifiliis]EGR30301.1 ribulose-phosphate 3-epimerase, putative [Ichthyophthirius multifiliis]|eukprot:XP_004031888.1 ribulose-phosphate 3-epimerase, putative [Ichthyophthirius multifiliis]
MLDIQDNLERAINLSKAQEGQKSDLYEGSKLTFKILEKVLEKNGVVKINPEGEKFDPNYHEALFNIPDPTKENGTVAFVAQTGYKIQDRVLRPAKVGVTQKD